MKHPIILLAVLLLAPLAALHATDSMDSLSKPTASDVERIVTRLTAIRTKPASLTPCRQLPDGNLLGNGDVGVVVAGSPEQQTFYIGKDDFWVPSVAYGYLRGSGIGQQTYPIGGITVLIPALAGASFYQEMDFYRDESRSIFKKDNLTVKIVAKVPATENVLIVELENDGGEPLPLLCTQGLSANLRRRASPPAPNASYQPAEACAAAVDNRRLSTRGGRCDLRVQEEGNPSRKV